MVLDSRSWRWFKERLDDVIIVCTGACLMWLLEPSPSTKHSAGFSWKSFWIAEVYAIQSEGVH
jgi:hypothetical protein